MNLRTRVNKTVKEKRGEKSDHIHVSTIRRAQGKEFNIVIIDTVFGHRVGTLQNTGTLRTMLTRARYGLIVISDVYSIVEGLKWGREHSWGHKQAALGRLVETMTAPGACLYRTMGEWIDRRDGGEIRRVDRDLGQQRMESEA
ncbi:AAA domain-containing protein 3 [Elsinoe australis]|uniref:AAA domain-containing protein 3 n=1 Tax=Elsinoe australis TaxID=40998 RepID=A0A4U7BC00_9PEZI|nr:AAA domain-containing protein 3 [Elsinoe australis]